MNSSKLLMASVVLIQLGALGMYVEIGYSELVVSFGLGGAMAASLAGGK